jgi:hypothetical protein
MEWARTREAEQTLEWHESTMEQGSGQKPQTGRRESAWPVAPLCQQQQQQQMNGSSCYFHPNFNKL